MIAALIILASLVVVGGLLYLHHRASLSSETAPAESAGDGVGQQESADGQRMSEGGGFRSPETDSETDPDIDSGVCCGMHITCEKDSLLAGVSETVEYFDDEELDRFAGRAADGYAPEEIEEFRDVLLTLLPTDIAPWARSVQLRGITLPAEVREELLMIVAEARAAVDSSDINNS